MERFLDIVADKVIKRFGTDLSDFTFVLPGKRAYIMLREEIAKRATDVVWEPEFTTLTKLVSEYSGIEKANDIVLLAKLFQICRNRIGDNIGDNFDAFESWGSILIEDFSGIDCAMVDAKELFGNVSDLAEIDIRFHAPELDSESELILQKHAHPRNAEYRERFNLLWNQLYDIYCEFRENLLKSGIGYTGMISRKAAEEYQGGCVAKRKRFVFVGFNTFTEAEYTFIKALEPEAVYWDEYRFFDSEEANLKLNPDGCNIRKIGCPIEESIETHSDIERKIDIIDCPTDTIQCNVVRDILKTMDNVGIETAIVLADDALLPVMLKSIPENTDIVNVTTGLPLNDSPAYIYYRRLRSIILERRDNSFLRKDIEFILDYPCLASFWEENPSIIALRKRMKDNLTPIVDVSDVDDELFRNIFRKVDNPGSYIMEQLSLVASKACDIEFTEAAAKMCIPIETLSTIVGRYGITLSNPLFLSILEKSFGRGYLPYDTDAMSGLQITGILETRCQDFKNLFILSADDDTLPKKSHLLSFIPTGLRRHYKLPMSGDFQRMSASYFYHLLMRAENVWILYNGNSTDSRSGEASRFIQQIKYLKPANTRLEFKTVTSPLKNDRLPVLRFNHSPKFSEIISKTKFSASMINTYLTCQKRFVLQYIYKVRAKEEVSDGFKRSDVGTAVHAILENICAKGYSNVEAGKILSDFDNAALPTINDVGFAWIHSKYPHLVGTGEMLLLENRIVKQIKGVLTYDCDHGEFRTVAAEENCTGLDGFTMKIDRRDIMADGTVRIVDYKSSEKNRLRLRELRGGDTETKIEYIFKEGDGRNKDKDPLLQTMLYGLAYRRNKVIPAIYSLPLLSDPSYSPYPDGKYDPIPEEYVEAFAKKLKQVTDEMTDPDPAREYTAVRNAGPRSKYCNICDFKLFCGF